MNPAVGVHFDMYVDTACLGRQDEDHLWRILCRENPCCASRRGEFLDVHGKLHKATLLAFILEHRPDDWSNLIALFARLRTESVPHPASPASSHRNATRPPDRITILRTMR